MDLSGLPETAVDSEEDDDEEDIERASDPLMSRDIVRDCLEKDPMDRTDDDIGEHQVSDLFCLLCCKQVRKVERFCTVTNQWCTDVNRVNFQCSLSPRIICIFLGIAFGRPLFCKTSCQKGVLSKISAQNTSIVVLC